ncbi:META domain-containing protein [Microbacterium sp. A93]|uniref:META domain-containing protein n=1 Tax=Microbacterium sp. A93 TaxID=3450716 RepID=UPI003F4440B9
MRTRTSRILTLAAMAGAVTLLVTACSTGTEPGSAPTSSAEPDPAVVAELVGVWGEDAAGQPHLEFTEDGDVSGSDGCNGIFSTYTADDAHIELAQFASTLKACEGVDDWLRGVRAVEIDGDVLVVMDDAGEKIGELTRAE